MKKKHHGHGTKSVEPKMHGKGPGSNLKLPKPSQAIHVKQQKDKMAKNVSNHMEQGDDMGPRQQMMASGGNSAPKKIRSI